MCPRGKSPELHLLGILKNELMAESHRTYLMNVLGLAVILFFFNPGNFLEKSSCPSAGHTDNFMVVVLVYLVTGFVTCNTVVQEYAEVH